MGPMPAHEWRGTELRFELEPGVWGEWIDLQGPPGIFGGGPINISEIVAAVAGNSYFPAGW